MCGACLRRGGLWVGDFERCYACGRVLIQIVEDRATYELEWVVEDGASDDFGDAFR